MLLIVDSEIDGPVRERLLVSFYRYRLASIVFFLIYEDYQDFPFSSRGASTGAHIDDVCRLFRGTGKIKGKRLPNYPENYFQ